MKGKGSMKSHLINQKNNFISAYYSDTLLSDSIVKYFFDYADKHPGTLNYSGNDKQGPGINDKIKKSTDAQLLDENLCQSFYNELQKCVDLYIEQYPWCNKSSPWSSLSLPNIQYYKPNEGYFDWHSERSSAAHPHSSRHLVYMLYLNDVTDKGETEFYHQKLKIKPEKGLMVIWPADWTFTHRGVPSPTQDKLIVTGWFNYTR